MFKTVTQNIPQEAFRFDILWCFAVMVNVVALLVICCCSVCLDSVFCLNSIRFADHVLESFVLSIGVPCYQTVTPSFLNAASIDHLAQVFVLFRKMAYQLGPFEIGQIKAHLEHGLGCTAIAKRLFKADRKTAYSEGAVIKAIAKLETNPSWRGEREVGSGAPRKTTKQQDSAIIKWVERNRGKKKVTVATVKKHFPFLRKCGDSLVEERLHDADLHYLRRRKKCLVTEVHLAKRVEYCRALKRKHETTATQEI